MGKKRCRAFLEEALGVPWAEIEREWRRREPIETVGVEVEIDVDTHEQPSKLKEQLRAAAKGT